VFVVLALLVAVLAVAPAMWIASRALAVATSPQVAGRRPPARPIGPDDDAEFLRFLRRRTGPGR
jgi:hypothetical protein